MGNECDHSEGSLMGKCVICRKTVCSDCFRHIFNEMICDGHESLEDESAWELVGFYSDSAALVQRRFVLEEGEITSIVVEGDEETIELYVPLEEKEDAFEALTSASDEAYYCEDCQVEYSPEMIGCPICGVKPVE